LKARAPLTTEQQCVAAKPTRNGEIVPACLWLASALRELELILDAAEGRDVFGSFLTVGTRAVRGAFQLKGEPKDAPQLEEILCNARRIYWRPLFTLASTLAVAQTSAGSSAGGSSTSGGPAATKPNSDTTQRTPSTGGSSGTTGASGGSTSSMPSTKDASTQGAETAASAEKKGDATSPGGTMKK
jgi:hypothetical protein